MEWMRAQNNYENNWFSFSFSGQVGPAKANAYVRFGRPKTHKAHKTERMQLLPPIVDEPVPVEPNLFNLTDIDSKLRARHGFKQ
jgi:hypothetical protein